MLVCLCSCALHVLARFCLVLPVCSNAPVFCACYVCCFFLLFCGYLFFACFHFSLSLSFLSVFACFCPFCMIVLVCFLCSCSYMLAFVFLTYFFLLLSFCLHPSFLLSFLFILSFFGWLFASLLGGLIEAAFVCQVACLHHQREIQPIDSLHLDDELFFWGCRQLRSAPRGAGVDAGSASRTPSARTRFLGPYFHKHIHFCLGTTFGRCSLRRISASLAAQTCSSGSLPRTCKQPLPEQTCPEPIQKHLVMNMKQMLALSDGTMPAQNQHLKSQTL